MIIWITEEDRHQAVLLNEPKVSFRILGHDVCILDHQGKYYLRLPRGLSCDSNGPLKHESRIRITDGTQNAILLCSMYAKGYDRFRKYEWPDDLVTLGNSIEDDLYLQDQNIQPHQFVFDRSHRMIFDRFDTNLAENDSTTAGGIGFENGTVFRVCNLQIAVHESFLMINTPENLYVHAKPWKGKEGILPPAGTTEPVARIYHSELPELCFEQRLPEPLPYQPKEHNPLVFMMGPALTMASASMAAGLISAYNGWLQGREWIELAPSVILPFVMVLSTLLWNPMQRLYEVLKEKRQKKKRNKDYESYLSHLKEQIISYEDRIQYEYERIFPVDFASSGRIYSAVSDSLEFSSVRIGVGPVPVSINLEEPVRWKADDPIPGMIQSLKNETSVLEMPAVCQLKRYRNIAVSIVNGNPVILRNWFFQFLYRTGPDLSTLVILADPAFLENHFWLRELPHVHLNPDQRLIASTLSQAMELSCLLKQAGITELFVLAFKPQLLDAFSEFEVHQIRLCENGMFPCDSDLRITVQEQEIVIDDGRICTVKPDPAIEPDPWKLCRLLNQSSAYTDSLVREQNTTIYDLYGITDAGALDLESRWKSNRTRDGIRSCFGLQADGEPMILDLHEQVHGPHGLIAGMTGSGKSELIISFLLGLCIQYSPQELNFVMIDFKGGGAAQLFSNKAYTIPHVAGTLSNLDSAGMERALVSFQNECHRREELFQLMSDTVGKPVMNLSSYQKCWNPELKLPYLASLVIIVDEFAELKKERPDFMRDLISIARVGRSLGMHMILATQKPSGVVDEQIWSNTRFKICLKVQEKQDSVEMIHAPDASWIRKPGEFYLLTDGMMTHGFSAYANASSSQDHASIQLLDAMKQVSREAVFPERSAPSQANTIIEQILEAGKSIPEAAPLWCPPLKELHRSDFDEQKAIWLGKADDYYHHRQPAVRLESSCTAVFSIDRTEKCRFFETLLHGLIEISKKEDEVFVIDDLSACRKEWNCWHNLCGCIQSSDSEKTSNLLAHLETGSSSSFMRTLIVTDTPSFHEASDTYRPRLHRLLEQAEVLKLRIILFFTSASSCPSRDLSLIPFRIALWNENLQDLSGIFECAVHQTVTKEYSALIRRSHLLQMERMRVTDSEIMEQIKVSNQKYGTEKPYQIPSLPERVDPNEWKGNGFPLGINVSTYEWSVLPENQNLIVLATYEEELYGFENYLKQRKKPFLTSPEETGLQTFQKENSGMFLCMTLETFQRSGISSRRLPVLYIGSGFREQYHFSIRSKRELHANNGVLFQTGRNQVIQLCETGRDATDLSDHSDDPSAV